MVERTTVRFEAPLLAGLELPCFEARGPRDGPRVCLLAGIHGCEYASIAGLTRFMRGLDARRLHGSVTAVPIVNITAFRARSPFVTPQDGKNLNRCFPGDPNGTFSDVLAHHIFQRLIAPSDHLIDLHGGDLVEALEPFTLYDESPVQAHAHAMALAFGLRHVICSERATSIGGTTVSAAAEAGIPAILPEAGGCGQLDEASIGAHISGLENTLRAIDVLDGDPEPPPRGMRLVRRFLWLRAPAAGWWAPDVQPGQEVGAGQRLGGLRDLHGEEVVEVTAPEAGAIMFVTANPAVAADGILLAVGGGIEEII
jgi:uncharacterized protein